MRIRSFTEIITTLAMYFAIFCGVWYVFKHIEPRLFPVITEFTIEEQEEKGRGILISGSFIKKRECRLVTVLAYDTATFINVIAPLDIPDDWDVSDEKQQYTSWELTPKSNLIKMYTTHECNTGLVITYLGEVILKSKSSS